MQKLRSAPPRQLLAVLIPALVAGAVLVLVARKFLYRLRQKLVNYPTETVNARWRPKRKKRP